MEAAFSSPSHSEVKMIQIHYSEMCWSLVKHLSLFHHLRTLTHLSLLPPSHHMHLLMREFSLIVLDSLHYSPLCTWERWRRKRGDLFSSLLVNENLPLIADDFLVRTSKKQNLVTYNHSPSVSKSGISSQSSWVWVQRSCAIGVSHLHPMV